MADAFTDRNGLNKMEEGQHSNEWGDILNINLGRLDVTGRGATQVAVTVPATLTANDITTTSSTAEESAFFNWIEFTGTPSATTAITVQAEEMVWRVYNNTDSIINLTPSGGTLTALAVGQAYILAYMPGDTAFTDLSAVLTVGNATAAATVTVADESSDTTCFPLFATAATGDLAAKSGSNLTFNSSSGLLTATSLGGTLTTAAQTNVTSLGNLTGLTVAGNLITTSVSPRLDLIETGVGTDQGYWRGIANGEQFVHSIEDDAVANSYTYQVVTRSGTGASVQVDTIDFTSVTDVTFNTGSVICSGGFTGALTGNADTVTTNANLTGDITSSGNATTMTVAAITGQTALTSGLADTDEFVISDGGVIKRMDASVLKTYTGNSPTEGTLINTTSGTGHDFTSIPSWVTRITMTLNGVGTDGTSPWTMFIGESVGGFETTGYNGLSMVTVSGGATTAISSGGGSWVIGDPGASVPTTGSIYLTRHDSATNVWMQTHTLMFSGNSVHGSGSCTLDNALDRVRLSNSGGDTYDEGTLNILYS